MAEHASNPKTREEQTEGSFEASQGYLLKFHIKKRKKKKKNLKFYEVLS